MPRQTACPVFALAGVAYSLSISMDRYGVGHPTNCRYPNQETESREDETAGDRLHHAKAGKHHLLLNADKTTLKKSEVY